MTKRDLFAKKVLTPKELQVYHALKGRRQLEFLAGRFSVKESFSKAWGTGLGEVSFQDVETLNASNGRPITTSTLYNGRILVTISHDLDTCITFVELEDYKWYQQFIGRLKSKLTYLRLKRTYKKKKHI
ncbi:putative holo-[acyl-carrier-protein] synthase [Lactobacillus jensenii SJ-7A-US]|nr:putative holo-[acyl-carrier-protein] synthase [Lactobacillus jensenii SJ-7A-US]